MGLLTPLISPRIADIATTGRTAKPVVNLALKTVITVCEPRKQSANVMAVPMVVPVPVSVGVPSAS